MTDPVLVVVDGSEVGWLALAAALERAGAAGCGVVALAVSPPRLIRGRAAHFDPEPEALDVAFADEVLTEAGARAGAAGVDLVGVRRTGGPVATIAAEAADHGARLVVVGRRPRLEGLELPDLTEQLVAATSVPVLVVDLPERPLPRPRR